MKKPTIKPFKNWTHHKDGTVSFFNQLTNAWERGDSKEYLNALREARKGKSA